MSTILIVEDEERIASFIAKGLRAAGFTPTITASGREAIQFGLMGDFDLIILDLGLPDIDGFDVLEELRGQGVATPIIMLTAKDDVEDKVNGLDIGADDYITKPFSMEELLLRIEAILRRTVKHDGDKEPQRVYQIGRYVFNTTTQTLSLGEQSRRLTTKECELLSLLCLFANQTLERGHALNVIWGITEPTGGHDSSFSQRSMDVYVTKLRRMLDADERVEIKNVHGKGYKLVVPVEA